MEKPKKVHALEFECQAPLNLYEACNACPRYMADCSHLKEDSDLGKGLSLLRKIESYDDLFDPEIKKQLDPNNFTCHKILNYIKRTRESCPRYGKEKNLLDGEILQGIKEGKKELKKLKPCRQEGLLISLLLGKRELNYRKKGSS